VLGAARADGNGAGAGLLNVAGRMAALGGSLSAVTAPGRGTTVTGRVPLLPPPPAAPEAGGNVAERG
jgi:hypothetical protein